MPSHFQILVPFLLIYLFYVHGYVCLRVCERVSNLGVTAHCELPCDWWDLNLGPLEEQPVLLTAEPSLQPLLFYF